VIERNDRGWTHGSNARSSWHVRIFETKFACGGIQRPDGNLDPAKLGYDLGGRVGDRP
jgi:hypothetical protein